MRRVLGRLFTHTDVRTLPTDRMTLSACVRSFPAVAAPRFGPGENVWQPAATVSGTAIPRAEAGSRNQNLLPTVRLAGERHALTPPELRQIATHSRDACRVGEAVLTCSVDTVSLPAPFLTLLPSPIAVSRLALLSAPPDKNLSQWPPAVPKVKALRVPRLPAPRVLWGEDDVLIRMDLMRRCRETPPDVTPSQAFPAERRRLAEAAGLSAEEVTLLGIYPGIPILAVSRLVVEDEGRRLRLWLKPAAMRAGGRQRLITLLVGRRTADGKMLQAAL